MFIDISARRLKKCRGIIVWDFDGVLFDIERYRLDNRRVWLERGIPKRVSIDIIEKIRRSGKHFSITQFLRLLRKKGYRLPEKIVRGVFHKHLIEKEYYSPLADRLLHNLRKKGFIHIILSMGNSSFQRKKMFVGCGSNFTRHFERIFVTSRPKFMILSQIRKRFWGHPLLFIDDTQENLELAKRHVPGIIAIHYSNVSGHSLKRLEKQILRHAAFFQR